jgi:hypothetical protein
MGERANTFFGKVTFFKVALPISGQTISPKSLSDY